MKQKLKFGKDKFVKICLKTYNNIWRKPNIYWRKFDLYLIDKTLPKDPEKLLLAAESFSAATDYVRATLDEIIALADTGKARSINF